MVFGYNTQHHVQIKPFKSDSAALSCFIFCEINGAHKELKAYLCGQRLVPLVILLPQFHVFVVSYLIKRNQKGCHNMKHQYYQTGHIKS